MTSHSSRFSLVGTSSLQTCACLLIPAHAIFWHFADALLCWVVFFHLECMRNGFGILEFWMVVDPASSLNAWFGSCGHIPPKAQFARLCCVLLFGTLVLQKASTLSHQNGCQPADTDDWRRRAAARGGGAWCGAVCGGGQFAEFGVWQASSPCVQVDVSISRTGWSTDGVGLLPD